MPGSRGFGSMAACLAILIAARFTDAGSPRDPPTVDPSEVAGLVAGAEDSTLGSSARESIRRSLREDDMSEEQISQALQAIETRRRKALVRFARTLRGRPIGIEEARAAVRSRAAILEHNARCRPRAYANGLPTTFVVETADAQRLRLGLDALVYERERTLRESVRDLAVSGAIRSAEATLLRDFARANTWARASATLDAMRGAAFFSAEDASRYLDDAVAADLEKLRHRIMDPLARRSLLDQAQTASAVVRR